MRSFLLILIAHCLLISASPTRTDLTHRTVSNCDDPIIKVVTVVLKQFAAPASKICSDILKRGPPPTTTSTIVATVSETITKGTTIVTQTEGVATTTSTTTVTSTTGTISTTTATETITTVSSLLTTSVATVTSVVTESVTTTATSYNPVYDPPRATKKKRATPDTVGAKYPGCPLPLSSVDLSLATKACDCFIPVQTSTVKITSTSTSTFTIPATSTTVVPSSTSTVISTSTVYSTVDTSTTVTSTITTTSVVPVTTTSTTTSTSTTTEIVATVTAVATTTFTKQIEQSDGGDECSYSRVYGVLQVPADPDNNFKTGVDFCASECAAYAGCKFFFYMHTYVGQAYCLFDGYAYDPTFLKCGDSFGYVVGYNKGTTVVT